MKRKLLTIAIPIYMRYDNLCKLLNQIDEQVYKDKLEDDIEILICDNTGPEKQNFELIAPFLSKSYLRYVDNEKNIGAVNNYFKVIEKSSGKYCLPSGDDEELLEGKLVECIEILKNLPDNITVIIFDKEMIANQLVLNCFQAAEKYYWYSGNLGVSVVNIDAIKYSFSYIKRNTIWPQLEIVFYGAFENKYNFFIVNNHIMHSSNHRKNTRYNSYYLLEAGFVSLIKTVLNLESFEIQQVAIKNINSRYKNLLRQLLFQYIFNDTNNDTEKTRLALSECRKKYKQYIFDKAIFRFNLLSRIPKWVYVILLKILNKYDNLEMAIKNSDNKIKISDDYT